MEELRRQQQELTDQQARLERHVRRSERLLYAFGVAMVSVILAFGLTIAYIVVSSQGSKEATCAVIEANRAEKRAQLQQYEQNPPTTELARKLQHTYQDSLATWDRLWSTLGCKNAAPPGP